MTGGDSEAAFHQDLACMHVQLAAIRARPTDEQSRSRLLRWICRDCNKSILTVWRLHPYNGIAFHPPATHPDAPPVEGHGPKAHLEWRRKVGPDLRRGPEAIAPIIDEGISAPPGSRSLLVATCQCRTPRVWNINLQKIVADLTDGKKTRECSTWPVDPK